MTDLQAWLGAAAVDDAVLALRPDYRAVLLTADGLRGGPSDETSDRILRDAESTARQLLDGRSPEQLPHPAAWRDAYRAFGAKPQRTRPSVEALLRRLEPDGLPRIDRITDVYNAVSVLHQVPVGGEDLAHYVGPPRLSVATGAEPFDTVADGETVIEHPVPGEVVWGDDEGVTCRRWNWRQGRRTQLTEATTSALFILDALEPMTDDALMAAADDLVQQLRGLAPDVRVATRLISGGHS